MNHSYRVLSIILKYLFLCLFLTQTLPCLAQEPLHDSSSPEPELSAAERAGLNASVRQAAEPLLQLGEDERRWISDHPVLRVANEPDWAPYNFFANGKARGYSIDLVRVAAAKAGLGVEFVSVPDKNSFAAMSRQGQVDVLPTMWRSRENNSDLLLTSAYLSTPIVVVTRRNSFFASLDDLNGTVVASSLDHTVFDWLKNNTTRLSIRETDSVEEALWAVSTGRVDAMVDFMGAVSYAIRNKAIPGLRVAFEINQAATGPSGQLHFAVPANKPLLAAILEKSLNAVTQEEKETLFRQWIAPLPAAFTPAQASHRPQWQWLLLSGLVLIAFLLLLMAILPRLLSDELLADLLDSGRLQIPVLAGITLIALSAGSLISISLSEHRTSVLSNTRDDLLVTLERTVERLDNWVTERSNYLTQLGSDPVLSSIVRQYLQVSTDADESSKSVLSAELRLFFEARKEQFGEMNYFIVTPNGINMSSAQPGCQGEKNHIAVNSPELFKRALNGEVVLITSKLTDVSERVCTGEVQSTQYLMYFASPVRDAGGEVIAVLLQGLDNRQDLSDILRHGRIGVSGESYAFDRNGLLLSESRFRDQLISIDLVQSNEHEAGAIQVRDPGGSLLEGRSTEDRHRWPLTRAAATVIQSAAQGIGQLHSNIFSDLNGYNDYRGVPVFGVGLWHFGLGMGVVTEIDVDEAMAAFLRHRVVLLSVTASLLFLFMLATLTLLSVARRAGASMRHSQNQLEDQVRKRTAQLQKSKLRYQQATSAVSEAVWDWNLKTGKRYFSSGFFRRLGYSSNEVPRNNDEWLVMIHPDDRAMVPDSTQDDPAGSAESTPHTTVQYRVRKKSGDYIYAESRGRVVKWSTEGHPLLQRGTLRDVTKQREILDTLRERERAISALYKRFEHAAELISLGIWQLDLDGSGQFVPDKRMCDIYGLENKPVMHMKEWYALVHPQDVKSVEDAIARLRSTGEDVRVEFRIIRPDGTLRHIYSGATLLKGVQGEPDRMYGVNWDITDRKEADERFSTIVENLPLAIVIVNQQGEIVLENRQAQEEVGDNKSLLGRNVSDFYLSRDEYEEVLTALSRDGNVLNRQVSYRIASGQVIECLVSVISLVFDGAPATLATVVNLTERIHMEKQLARAKEEAERASRFKGEFVANMSHEIRTPLNTIVGLTHLLERTSLNAKQSQYIVKTRAAIDSLLAIIEDVLDISKMEAGHLDIEQVEFSLDEVLSNLGAMTSKHIKDKPLELLYRIDKSVPDNLVGDPIRLSQVLNNLVNNAIKFTESGHVIVSVDTVRPENRLTLKFTVEDTGIGISADKLAGLFRPFVQADGSITRRFGGTGLGLSICRQLIELMGGYINVTSTPGQGSRFTFDLPLRKGEQASRWKVSSEFVGKRVLLVDDNKLVREILRDMLETLSFHVDVADSGEQALEYLAKSEDPNCTVLMDWRMSTMDGVETARRARSISGCESLPIFLMTACGSEVDEKNIDLIHVSGVLVRPFTPSQLLETIQQNISSHCSVASATSADISEFQTLQTLSGNVLLVEDSAINQQVARELLEQMGLTVRVSSNGLEAINCIRTNMPDIVLMDIQIPEFDGYETAQRIRSMPNGASLPIIAMTAHAMSGDEERSRSAGMNAHIIKPIQPGLLNTTLSMWLPAVSETRVRHKVLYEKADIGALDWEARLPGLDPGRGLAHTGNNRELYVRLLTQFVCNQSDIARFVTGAIANGSFSEIRKRMHTLQGVAATIGAIRLANGAKKLEQSLNDNYNINEAQGEEFRLVCEELFASIDRWFESSDQDA